MKNISAAFLLAVLVYAPCRGDSLKGPWDAETPQVRGAPSVSNQSLDRQFGVFVLGVYQKLISPHMGTNCQFYPSCSEYCKQAVIKYGFFNGWLMGIERLTRCNRWARERGYPAVEINGSRKLKDFPEDNLVPRKDTR